MVEVAEMLPIPSNKLAMGVILFQEYHPQQMETLLILVMDEIIGS